MQGTPATSKLSVSHDNPRGGVLRTSVTGRRDSAAVKPARDPLMALEAARRIAHEEEMAERWDGLS